MIMVITTDENGSSRRIVSPLAMHVAFKIAMLFENSAHDRTATVYFRHGNTWRRCK